MTGVEEVAAIAAIAGAVATAAGAGMSYISSQNAAAAQKRQAEAQAASAKNQADYKERVDSNNAELAKRAAADAASRGDVNAQKKADMTAQLQGRQRAILAGNGVEVDSGSALDLTSDTAAAGALDQLTIQSNAHREEAGYLQQGMNYQAQAGLDRAAGDDALYAGQLKADAADSDGAYKGAAAITSGVSSVAGQWYNFNYGTGKKA